MGREDARSVYETLVRRHGGDLYRLAYRLVGDAVEAEELVQETYFQAWRSIDLLREPEAGRAWLGTILRRRWMRGLREEGRRPQQASGEADVDAAPSPLPGPDLGLLARRESVQAALGRLEPRFREPFLLVFLEGLSCREAAERLSIPLGTVLSRIHRARASLRVFLREEPEASRGAGEARAAPGGAP